MPGTLLLAAAASCPPAMAGTGTAPPARLRRGCHRTGSSRAGPTAARRAAAGRA
jgi:hypothetical protein